MLTLNNFYCTHFKKLSHFEFKLGLFLIQMKAPKFSIPPISCFCYAFILSSGHELFFSAFFFSLLLQIWNSMPPPWGSSPRLHLGEIGHLTYPPSIDFWALLRTWNHLVEQHWDDSSQDIDSVYPVHFVEYWGRGRILLNRGKTRITHSSQPTGKKVGLVAL